MNEDALACLAACVPGQYYRVCLVLLLVGTYSVVGTSTYCVTSVRILLAAAKGTLVILSY